MDDEQVVRLLGRTLGEIDGWNYLEKGTYPPDLVAVFWKTIRDQPETAVGAVGITVYDGSDADNVSIRRVQFVTRGAQGDEFSPDRIAADIFRTFHEVSRANGITWAQRRSFGSLGVDGTGRWMRSDNYEFTLDNQEVLG